MNDNRSRRRQSGRPTVSDVARLAGCSQMTVSRVINGGTGVREETRLAVEAAIREIGYAPNPAARSLAGATQLRIALLHANPSSAYLSELLIGCLDAAGRLDAHLVVERHDPGHGRKRLVADMAAGLADGLLLPPPLCDDAALLADLAAEGIAAMLIGPGEAPVINGARHGAVMIDDRAAAREMTRHLIALGHRRIGFIIGNPAQSASALRLAGFRDAMADAGLAIDDALVRQGQFTYRSGLDAAMAMLAATPRPTAIFASNDDMAAGCIAAAHRNRLDLPRDLSVCGFDDTPLASTIWPELTTIRQPIRAMADAAFERLAQQIRAARQHEPRAADQVLLDHTLVRRQSDAPPAES